MGFETQDRTESHLCVAALRSRSSFDVTSSPSNILYNLPQSTTREPGIVKSFNRRPLRPPTIDIVVFVIVFVLGAGAFADWLPRYRGLDLVRSTIGWKQRSGAAASKTRVLLPWGGCKRGAQTWQASISARPLRVNGQVDDHRRLIKRGSRASRLPAIAASFAQLHRMDFLIATPRGERLPVFEHPAIPNGNEIRQLFLYLLQITRLPPRINYTKFEKSKGILLYRG